MKVGVILGSVRPNRMSDRVCTMLTEELERRGHNVTVFDPIEIDLPLLVDYWIGPNEEKPKNTTQELTQKTNNSLKVQEAFIICTPEYNFRFDLGSMRCRLLVQFLFSIPPALSNFIAHFPYDSFQWKCVSIISYSMGPFGGVRCQAHLRSMCSIIGLTPLPTAIVLPVVQTWVIPSYFII